MNSLLDNPDDRDDYYEDENEYSEYEDRFGSGGFQKIKRNKSKNNAVKKEKQKSWTRPVEEPVL